MLSKAIALFCIVFGVSATLGCGPVEAAKGGSGGSGGAGGSGGSAGSGGGTGLPAVVYAHSDSTLYQVNPDTFAVTAVGAFRWPSGIDQMTDIAIDRNGKMTAISYGSVYAVDINTAACTFLSALDRSFVGLSFVPVQGPDPTAQEVLLATAIDGSVYRLDPMTGRSTPLGNFGGDLTSSGDVVSVDGFGTVATVKHADTGNDFLARVDTATGAATVIGDTGFVNVWGLGFWKGKVYGFTNGAQFVLIDPATGAGTMVQSSGASWWGAGVTTKAPVVP